MAVEFVRVGPDTDQNHCPTVWMDADTQEVLSHRGKPSPETQAQCEGTSPTNGPMPETEAIVRIPARMIPMIREACSAVERSQLR